MLVAALARTCCAIPGRPAQQNDLEAQGKPAVGRYLVDPRTAAIPSGDGVKRSAGGAPTHRSGLLRRPRLVKTPQHLVMRANGAFAQENDTVTQERAPGRA